MEQGTDQAGILAYLSTERVRKAVCTLTGCRSETLSMRGIQQ